MSKLYAYASLIAAAALSCGPASAQQFALFAPPPQQQAALPQNVVPDTPADDQSDENAQVDPRLQKQIVDYPTREAAGSVIVDTPHTYLYYVLGGGKAIRYGIGVGRSEGTNFHGSAVIGRKEKWPHWTPTANMMAAIPMYRHYAGGMNGGPDNPLGPRALYLYRDGHDTFFRLHGTTEPESIGQAVSSGCIRLFNQDIIDLYNRVPVGAHVTVVQG